MNTLLDRYITWAQTHGYSDASIIVMPGIILIVVGAIITLVLP